MRKLAVLLALTLAPAHAWALNTDQLLSTIAMPLAVAAVSNASCVPQDQLSTLVSTLNQANVPPDEFVEVIRYVPVTMVDQNGQPFVAYVQEQTSQGVTGNALIDAIVNRLQSNYHVTPVMSLNEDPTSFVLSDNYIPSHAHSRYATPAYASLPYTSPYSSPYGSSLMSDALSCVALPLAVDAVSNIAGVPQDELANLVATLDNANVPPAEEIEIIRYSPVALVDENGQPFIAYVQQQVAQGVTGPALAPVVVQQLQSYYPAQTQIAVTAPAPVYRPAPVTTAAPARIVRSAPQPVIVEREYTPPPIVISRVQEFRAHPHGGPPGQFRRPMGYQTGAEVAHGGRAGRQFTPAPVAPAAPVAVIPREEHGHGRGREQRQVVPAPAPMISSAPPMAAPPPAPAPAPAAVAPPPGHPAGGPPGPPPGKGPGHGHGEDK